MGSSVPRSLVKGVRVRVTARLGRDFFEKESLELSRALLGKVLARRLGSGEVLRGTIVETEAYPGAAEGAKLQAHVFITKRTEKNEGLFLQPGTTWVYMTYGLFNMMNISAKGKVHIIVAVRYTYDRLLGSRSRSRLPR